MVFEGPIDSNKLLFGGLFGVFSKYPPGVSWGALGCTRVALGNSYRFANPAEAF